MGGVTQNVVGQARWSDGQAGDDDLEQDVILLHVVTCLVLPAAPNMNFDLFKACLVAAVTSPPPCVYFVVLT